MVLPGDVALSVLSIVYTVRIPVVTVWCYLGDLSPQPGNQWVSFLHSFLLLHQVMLGTYEGFPGPGRIFREPRNGSDIVLSWAA